jgi:hypothetical protein
LFSALPSPTDLFFGLLISAIGSAYLVYGRRESHSIALICGLCLLIFPSIVTDSTARLLLTVVLMGIPWLSSRA